ncbi:CoA pyrophosphatase, partial [Aeromonas sp. CPF2-S1]|nr:CoA pyrophosphatase [Aeromonas sp. CPF2-S1]
LAHVLDPGQHIALSLPRADGRHTIYWIPWEQSFIWGATASMIRQLAQHIST